MTSEEIVGIIPNTNAGFLGQKAYNLVVTNNRLIVATLTSEMIKEEAKKAREQSKSQGAGFLKSWANTMTSSRNIHEKYYSMPVENILNENPNNYSISVNEVKKIRIKNYMNFSDEKRRPNEIRIKWSNGKETFKFTSINSSDVKTILKKTFGNLVK